jgi:hypothetical protein
MTRNPSLDYHHANILTVADGTPRDCSSNGCGSQADTSIIRDREIASGKVGPLGRTEGNGPVDPAVLISSFMGSNNNVPVNNGTGTGQEDDIPNNLGQKRRRAYRRSAHQHKAEHRRQLDKLLGGLLGGGGDNKGEKTEEPEEVSVAAAAGDGSKSGLPTASDDGVVTLKYRQVRGPHLRFPPALNMLTITDQPGRCRSAIS